jgi:hypothetical protein
VRRARHASGRRRRRRRRSAQAGGHAGHLISASHLTYRAASVRPQASSLLRRVRRRLRCTRRTARSERASTFSIRRFCARTHARTAVAVAAAAAREHSHREMWEAGFLACDRGRCSNLRCPAPSQITQALHAARAQSAQHNIPLHHMRVRGRRHCRTSLKHCRTSASAASISSMNGAHTKWLPSCSACTSAAPPAAATTCTGPSLPCLVRNRASSSARCAAESPAATPPRVSCFCCEGCCCGGCCSSTSSSPTLCSTAASPTSLMGC